MAKYSKPMSSNVLKMHEFKPGASGNPRGRPPGRKNKNSQRMRDAIKRVMDRVGDKRTGEKGHMAFLARIAEQFPLEFFVEACRLEPKMVAAAIDEQFNVNIEYRSPEEARAALAEAGTILDAKPVRPVIAADAPEYSVQESTAPRADDAAPDAATKSVPE